MWTQLGLIAALVPAAAAQAAVRPVVVLGPGADGVTVTAHASKTGMCVGLRRADHGPASTSCSSFPLTPRTALMATAARDAEGGDAWLAGAVSDSVAAVEIVGSGPAEARIPTQAPARAVPGVDGVRYFESPMPRTGWTLRTYDADGRLLGVVPAGFTEAVDDVDAGGLAPVLGNVRGGGRLVTYDETRLAPTPEDPGRHETLRCAGVRIAHVQDLMSRTCADPARAPTFEIGGLSSTCGATGTIVTGVAGARVRRVIAVRGDGSAFRGVVRDLPRSGGRRAFAVHVAARFAIRRLEFLAADGATLARTTLAQEPATAACVRAGGWSAFAILGALTEPSPDAPHDLVVADGPAERLCINLDRLRRDHADCALPPLDEFPGARVLALRDGAGWRISGITLPEARSVGVRLAGGRVVSAATTMTIPGYSGRHAGRVPFFELRDLPARPLRISLRDARSRELVRLPVFILGERPHVVGAPRRLTVDGVALEVAGVDRGGGFTEVCAGLAAPAAQFATACDAAQSGFATIAVDCARRRMVLVTALGARERAAEVVDADGDVQTLHVVRVGTTRAAVGVLARAATPVALRLRAHTARTFKLALPPATEQCGYRATVFTRFVT